MPAQPPGRSGRCTGSCSHSNQVSNGLQINNPEEFAPYAVPLLSVQSKRLINKCTSNSRRGNKARCPHATDTLLNTGKHRSTCCGASTATPAPMSPAAPVTFQSPKVAFATAEPLNVAPARALGGRIIMFTCAVETGASCVTYLVARQRVALGHQRLRMRACLVEGRCQSLRKRLLYGVQICQPSHLKSACKAAILLALSWQVDQGQWLTALSGSALNHTSKTHLSGRRAAELLNKCGDGYVVVRPLLYPVLLPNKEISELKHCAGA